MVLRMTMKKMVTTMTHSDGLVGVEAAVVARMALTRYLQLACQIKHAPGWTTYACIAAADHRTNCGLCAFEHTSACQACTVGRHIACHAEPRWVAAWTAQQAAPYRL